MSGRDVSAGNIRLMGTDDLLQVLLWRNHPTTRQSMYTKHEISVDEHNKWFEVVSKDDKQELLIFEMNDKPLGFVQIRQQKCTSIGLWGFYLAPNAARGTGHCLGKAALNYAFNTKSFHKLCGEVICNNERSILFHKRLGFQLEGILRDNYFDGERYNDIHCFGLLAREWCDERVER